MRKIRERFKIRIPVEALFLDWDFFVVLRNISIIPKSLMTLMTLTLMTGFRDSEMIMTGNDYDLDDFDTS